MKAHLSQDEFEAFYDELARAIDAVPAADECAFLTRLCLLLSHRYGDIEIVRTAVADALAANGQGSDAAT